MEDNRGAPRHAWRSPLFNGVDASILTAMGGRASSAQFVGRVEDLARFQAALARASGGASSGALVGGEAGVGKSRLLSEFSDRAAQAGAAVLRGSCLSVAGGAAYAPVSEALRPLTRQYTGPMRDWLVGDGRRELALLLPELGSGGDEDAAAASPSEASFGQDLLFVRVLELLERLAGEQPVVLVIEDLHWADRSTRALLVFLARNLRDAAVMLAGSYRTESLRRGDPLRSFLLELDHSGVVERLELARFDRVDVQALLEGVLGVPPAAAVVDDILARSDGNAFFAEELLVAMRRGDLGALPPTLRDLLLDRVEVLTDLGRDVLARAAVAGRTVDHRLLADVAGLDDESLLAGVREAVEHQLLLPQPDGRSYAFRHALTQEAIYSALPAGDRLRWHAALAQAVADRPELAGVAGPAVLAHHWDAAGDSERALPARVEAGLAAERVYGFAEALLHFSRAAELWHDVRDPSLRIPLDRVDLLARAADAAGNNGDHGQAAQLLSQALDEADPDRAAVLQERLGWSHFAGGDVRTGRAEVQAALERLPRDAPPRGRAWLLATNGLWLTAAGRLADARACCEEAIALARQVGAGDIEARALNGLGVVVALLGDVEAGIEHLLRARALAVAGNHVDDLARSYMNHGFVLAWVGRMEEALAVYGEALARSSQAGLGVFYSGVRANHAAVLFDLGRWDDAQELLAGALALAPSGFRGLLLHILRATLETARGRFAAADAALAACRRCSDVDEDFFAVTAELALWRGDADGGRAAVAQALRLIDEDSETSPADADGWLPWLGLRAEADRIAAARALRRDAVLAESRCTAEALITRARSARSDAPPARAYLELCEAEWSRAESRSDPDRWAEAAAGWESLGNGYRCAYARWRQAEALADAKAGSQETAVPLRQAHAEAVRLGAAPLRDAIELLAVRTRVSLITDAEGPEPPQPGPADELGLTPREQQVLLLLAEGNTNQEIGKALFISAKTASVHVSNILGKLEVSGRGQAAAVAHRLGLLDAGAGRAGSAT